MVGNRKLSNAPACYVLKHRRTEPHHKSTGGVPAIRKRKQRPSARVVIRDLGHDVDGSPPIRPLNRSGREAGSKRTPATMGALLGKLCAEVRRLYGGHKVQSARRGALKLKLTGKHPAQITPTMIKTPISTSRSVPVAAEMKNKSPNDRNCMIRLPISKEAALHRLDGVSRGHDDGAASRRSLTRASGAKHSHPNPNLNRDLAFNLFNLILFFNT